MSRHAGSELSSRPGMLDGCHHSKVPTLVRGATIWYLGKNLEAAHMGHKGLRLFQKHQKIEFYHSKCRETIDCMNGTMTNRWVIALETSEIWNLDVGSFCGWAGCQFFLPFHEPTSATEWESLFDIFELAAQTGRFHDVVIPERCTGFYL